MLLLERIVRLNHFEFGANGFAHVGYATNRKSDFTNQGVR
jgi:hypothetical protein